MRKGGYKIVDFKSAELTSTVIVRQGIYSQIIDNYDKPILVSGVSIGGTIKDDAFASVKEITEESGDSVELGVYGGIITVTEDDEVNFVPSKSNTELDENIEELESALTNKIGYADINLSGLTITTASSGWYYREVSATIPSTAKIIAAMPVGEWDVDVIMTTNGGNNNITLRSLASKTVGSNRKARVYYYIP